jgi:hypothetical protein
MEAQQTQAGLCIPVKKYMSESVYPHYCSVQLEILSQKLFMTKQCLIAPIQGHCTKTKVTIKMVNVLLGCNVLVSRCDIVSMMIHFSVECGP